ncbi:hypothetical protein TspCOW1_17660 [Thiohalobacter sp. COW1]|uniref:hypothetical protein n=1 Tax=Thiohalobacter sp. COW1 TaxID=2795687 RepID=UPI001915CBBB|nr:hypothetical protein [Thiohalobacter sp. COW1]BCO31663.1 hypothetical protein TspCOW1_17660 [Thiohalobacter sp. COW1]
MLLGFVEKLDKKISLTGLVLALFSHSALAVQVSSFLPDYYAPALKYGGWEPQYLNETEKEGVQQAVYGTFDDAGMLMVEHIDCVRSRCHDLLNAIASNINDRMETAKKGRFVSITDTTIRAMLQVDEAELDVQVFVLPASIQIWTFSSKTDQASVPDESLEGLEHLVNRQRYEEALAGGNVQMGVWSPHIRQYAEHLIGAGDLEAGLHVLERHLKSSPADYRAHALFFRHSPDNGAAADSARVVLENAEIRQLIDAAAEFLGRAPASVEDFPEIHGVGPGLQVVLVPLPPCNPWLVTEVAEVFNEMTDIPVRIMRLKESWQWGKADRIPRQRAIEAYLVQSGDESIDFGEWTKSRYVEALYDAAESEDALSRYYVEETVGAVETAQGQFEAEPPMQRLHARARMVHFGDRRTMYVGITGVDIYHGDANFVFSLGGPGGDSGASILSYHRMRAEIHGTNSSRARLVERIAKELVPASLKQLEIERPADPRCPYSYSSGVERLDQKAMTLCPSVKQALDQLRSE